MMVSVNVIWGVNRLNRKENTISGKKRCYCTKGRRRRKNHHSKKNVEESFFFLLIASICVSRGCLPSFLNGSSLALKHVGVWEGGGWPWFDSPGRMELCSFLCWIHSNVSAHICTHKAHTHTHPTTHTHTHLHPHSHTHKSTHTHTSTIYVCEDEMRSRRRRLLLLSRLQDWSCHPTVKLEIICFQNSPGDSSDGWMDGNRWRTLIPCTALTFCSHSLKSSFFSFFPVVVVVVMLYKHVDWAPNQLYDLLTAWRHNNVIQFKILMKSNSNPGTI